MGKHTEPKKWTPSRSHDGVEHDRAAQEQLENQLLTTMLSGSVKFEDIEKFQSSDFITATMFACFDSFKEDLAEGSLPNFQNVIRLSGGSSDLIERLTKAKNAQAHYGSIEALTEPLMELVTAKKLHDTANHLKIEINEYGTEAAIDKAQQRIEAIAAGNTKERDLSMQAHLAEWLDHFQATYEGRIQTFKTGFDSLDQRTLGFEGGTFNVIGGRPAMGKTVLAMNIALNSANRGEPTAFFSFEMQSRQLMQRFLSMDSQVELSKIRDPHYLLDRDQNAFAQVGESMKRLKELPLYIEDSGGLKIGELIRRIKILKKTKGITSVWIDYLQLINPDREGDHQNKNIEIGSFTRRLKALSKELDIPIFCLAQVNRDVENRADKRPAMADLRDSGEIEQDCDSIFFCYRPSVYHEDADPTEFELVGRKLRQGQIGSTILHCELSRQFIMDGLNQTSYEERKQAEKEESRSFGRGRSYKV